MAFRNCYHKDCPTPKIYISPVIPETTISSSHDVATFDQLTVPAMKKEEEFEDYIVVYCDSDHKNIIPIKMPEEETES